MFHYISLDWYVSVTTSLRSKCVIVQTPLKWGSYIEHCFLLTHYVFFCHLPLPLHSKVMTCLKWPFKQMQIFQMADVILNCSERQQTPSLFCSFCFAVFFISTPSSLYHHLLPLFKNRFDRSMYDPLISDAFSKKPAFCCYDMATLVWICTCAE